MLINLLLHLLVVWTRLGLARSSETSDAEGVHQMVATSQLSGNICLFDTIFAFGTDFLKKPREKQKIHQSC
jgi:hypothetical protein